MINIDERLLRRDNESAFEWKLRLCLMKKRKEISNDWCEIRDILGLTITSDQLRKQAIGYYEYDEYIKNADCAGVAKRILCISDAHVPFNLPVSIYKEYSGKVDILVFNGDIEDCHSCSTFPKVYRLPFNEEMVLTRQYIIDVINMIMPKQVYVVLGNHEYRLTRHLSNQLDDDILSIMPDSPLEMIIHHGFTVKDRLNKTETYYSSLESYFMDKNIHIHYDGDWKCKIGNVLFVHPLSYSSAMLKTTEKAVNYFLKTDRTFTGIVMAHTHKVGSYVQGGIKMYEQGCTCDLSKLDYNNGKLIIPGQNGFMYICLDEDGNIIDSATKLVTLN